MANYSKGKIAIPNVTGNIVINITAIESAKPNLFVSTPQYTPTGTGTNEDKVAIGGRLASGGVVKYWKDDVIVTRFIEARPGDSFEIRTDSVSSFPAGQIDYNWYSNGYKFDGTLFVHVVQEGTARWQFDTDGKGGIFTIPNNADWRGTEFVKISMPCVDINNITIYKR